MSIALVTSVEPILKFFTTLWQFALNHEDLMVGIATGVIGFLCWLTPRIWRRLKRKRSVLPPADTSPFQIIRPYSDRQTVLEELLGVAHARRNDPLADFNIPYQQRQSDRDIKRELLQSLEQPGWVLILGQTGLGKSREAVEVAQQLNERGWTILKLKAWEWLDKSYQPSLDAIGTDRQLLFFLDDLNTPLYRDQRFRQHSNQPDEMRLARSPLQDRLLELLEEFETTSRREQIRVIATARNEREPENDTEPSEWDKLELDKHPKFWNRFKQYELPKPEKQAFAQLLADTVPRTDIQADSGEFDRIARCNDDTFKNVVVNLRSAQDSNQHALTLETYQPTLKGSWAERYQKAIERDKTAIYIYEAVAVLRTVGVALNEFTVAPTAWMIAKRKHVWLRRFWLAQFFRKRRINRVLQHLIETESILQPSDGQIEASGIQINAEGYIPRLLPLLLKIAEQYPSEMVESLFYFGNTAYEFNYHQQAIDAYDHALKIKPDLHEAWYNRGNALGNLGRYQESIDSW